MSRSLFGVGIVLSAVDVYQDPVVGIFLSPDNFVQAPDYTQNFNRYGYAYNNPLMYTDPPDARRLDE